MNILMQFLVESLILCLLGGVVGILLGTGVSAPRFRAVRRLANHRVARGRRHCFCLQCGRGPVLRHLAGTQGRQPQSDRRTPLRVVASAAPRIRGFPPVVGRQPRLLILGSMPSEASLEAGQYYGLPRNAFWAIMGELFGAGRELPYDERLRILKRHGVALWDVLAECRRRGSLDASIQLRDARVNDLAGFFRRHRGIRRVYFNGSKAADVYRRRALPEVETAAPYLSPRPPAVDQPGYGQPESRAEDSAMASTCRR